MSVSEMARLPVNAPSINGLMPRELWLAPHEARSRCLATVAIKVSLAASRLVLCITIA